MDYATYQTELALLAVMAPVDPNFISNLPSAIDYAEQRIYRELDLLSTVFRDFSVNLVVGSRNFTIPSAFVVVNGINVISPAATAPDAGTRNPLTPTSRDYVDAVWNSAAIIGLPVDFAPITQWDFVLGPAPDAAYKIEVIGTQRPTPLSASNTTTFLSTNLPDLFLAASMIFMSGYARNFGQQSSDPAQAVSWETQYKSLSTSAGVEEARKRFQSAAWSSAAPAPIANPPRG